MKITEHESFYQRHLVSARELTREDVCSILKHSNWYKQKEQEKHFLAKLLAGNIIASCFFEPSTRTRLSFESAANRLGARVIGFSNDDNLSIRKGESLQDTIRVISGYADLI